MSNYLRRHELTEPGWYWWLPACFESKPEIDSNWSIIHWSEAAGRDRSGVFYGPLEAPTFTVVLRVGTNDCTQLADDLTKEDDQ